MATAIHNPSVELTALPSPLQGALKGGQRIVLSYSPATLAAACPSLDDVFKVTDLGAGYSGPTDDATYGLSGTASVAQTITVNDAVHNDLSLCMTLGHTTSGTAANGIGATLQFKAENDAGTAVAAGFVTGELTAVADGAEIGRVTVGPAVADEEVCGLRVQGADAAVNGMEVLPSATGVAVRVYPYGETNVSLRLAGKGTGSVALANPANQAIRVEADATGLGLWGATPAAQPAAVADLVATVAGDMPGPTAGEITTRLNLIETKLNTLLARLRTPGILAT